jgi:hypothetical protein
MTEASTGLIASVALAALHADGWSVRDLGEGAVVSSATQITHLSSDASSSLVVSGKEVAIQAAYGAVRLAKNRETTHATAYAAHGFVAGSRRYAKTTFLHDDTASIRGTIYQGFVRVPVSQPHHQPATEPETLPPAIRENWSLLARAKLSEPFFERLSRMAKRPLNWRGVGSRPLSTSSLAQFLHFWSKIASRSEEPDIALMPSGNLQAEWYRNSRHHLDLEFNEDGRGFFFLMDGAAVNEGVEPFDSLAETLLARASKPLKWRNG